MEVWSRGGFLPTSLKCSEPARADISGLFFKDWCKLSGPAEIYFSKRGVVQSLNKDEVECLNANFKDADLWIQV